MTTQDESLLRQLDLAEFSTGERASAALRIGLTLSMDPDEFWRCVRTGFGGHPGPAPEDAITPESYAELVNAVRALGVPEDPGHPEEIAVGLTWMHLGMEGDAPFAACWRVALLAAVGRSRTVSPMRLLEDIVVGHALIAGFVTAMDDHDDEPDRTPLN
jgi:hypothetical protein